MRLLAEVNNRPLHPGGRQLRLDWNYTVGIDERPRSGLAKCKRSPSTHTEKTAIAYRRVAVDVSPRAMYVHCHLAANVFPARRDTTQDRCMVVMTSQSVYVRECVCVCVGGGDTCGCEGVGVWV